MFRNLFGDRSAPSEAPQAASDERSSEQLSLLEILREDFETHDRNWIEPGFWAVTAHRLGVRVAAGPAPIRKPLEVAQTALATAVDWVWGINIPARTQLGRRVRIWHNGSILLNARSIGNDVHIRHDTTFGAVRAADAERAEALPVIGDRADIGSGACVLGGVTLGRGTVVGANTVVLKSTPENVTVFGVPARIIPT